MTAVAEAPTTAAVSPLARTAIRRGLLAALIMSFIGAIGMLETFNNRIVIRPILSLGYLVLFAIPFVAGTAFSRRVEVEGVETAPHRSADLLAAGGAGAIGGVGVWLFATLVQTFPGMRSVLPNLSPRLVEMFTIERGLGAGSIIVLAIAVASAVAGAVALRLPTRILRAITVGALATLIVSLFRDLIDDLFDWFDPLPDFLYGNDRSLAIVPAVVVFVVAAGLAYWRHGSESSALKTYFRPDDVKLRTRRSVILAVIVLIAFIGLPQILGGILNELLTNVGLYLLMGLGLNIVVGSAGLLDLGYVAFFAVGAYTTAVLTSPISPFWNPELGWWLALPIVILAAVLAGVLIGTPVIRMRGDYLAIVTLGFGEITRLFLLSDWMSPIFGGAQGIRQIPGIPFRGERINATTPELFIYAILAFVALSAYVSWRLQDSRIGRAWAALREDEDVAEAVGVDTVKAKLLAFVTGAVLASFAGALFSAKVGSVFTNSFEIIVSIVILVLVIVGGMGNIAGVAVGALVLIGILGGPNQPGLLQEFGEFKLLIYGALLVAMMLKRPEGLLPSVRRAQELHQDEFLQDAWLDKDGALAKAETAEES